MELKFKRLAHAAGIRVPRPETAGASGLDLPAAIDEPLEIAPGARELVPCGFAVEIPSGWEGQVRPRSGLAIKHGITVVNTPGTVDSDYRGELKVILINLGRESFTVERGDRIAQMVICPVASGIATIEVETLSSTERQEGGFGSTGVKGD